MNQASFDFPFLDHYLDDDFLLSEENSKAFNFISKYNLNSNNDSLPKVFTIYGGTRCGKTHLAHIWKRRMAADILNLDNLKDCEAANYIQHGKAYLIEDIHLITNQLALFHIFNIIVERGGYLMLTSNINPTYIRCDFADLSSRLKNIFALIIDNPGEELVKMLLIKQLSARQLTLESKVIDYLVKNLDRSYESVDQITKLLEFYCFEQKRKITIPVAAEAIKSLKKELPLSNNNKFSQLL